MVEDTESRRGIGWLRAIVTSAVIVVAAIAILVYGANALLTHVHGVRRSGLVTIVTPAFFLVLIGLAAALRWLQRRNLI